MTRVRMSASERGEQVLQAAVAAFAESGYAATKTDEIARLAGVSQPYVIRLFGTKRDLFLAATDRVCDRIEEIFRAEARQIGPHITPQEALRILGAGYAAFLADRELLLVQLHGFSASSDPAIGDDVRNRFGRIYQLIRELSGASVEDTRRFLATGMLFAVMAAMQVAGPNAIPQLWATEILDCPGDYAD
ncbi:TetR/AcrR family transcriptional regulator [Nocardia sp. CWNU-33]|uniref:TetR/AcrR family transcriptional regulator n=1 Tax=Nocardia sp. CWNU-33 TaxID=3392117 RepID=UPI00398E7DC3